MTFDETYSVVERQVEGTGEKVLKKNLPRAEAKAEVDRLRSQKSGQGVYFVMVKDSGGRVIKTLKDLNQAGSRFWSRPNRDDMGKRAQVKAEDDDLYDRIKAVAEGGINSKQRELLGYARGALSSGNRVSARKYLEQALAAEDSARDSIQTVAQAVAKELMSTGEKIKEIERRTGCTTEQAKQALAAVDSARDFSTTPAEIEAAAKKAKAAGKSKEDFVAGYSGGAAETAARVW